jgi:thioredoxin-related protein/cell division septation protein DedD
VKHTLTLLFAISLVFSGLQAEQIEFFEGSFAEAQDAARRSGKPLMVAFMASWSSGCRRMHQLVFTDDDLATTVNDEFVSVLVDVDDFDGIVLKEQFRVTDIPTFLRFDENGDLVDQQGGQMTAAELNLWLSVPGRKAPAEGSAMPVASKASPIVVSEPSARPVAVTSVDHDRTWPKGGSVESAADKPSQPEPNLRQEPNDESQGIPSSQNIHVDAPHTDIVSSSERAENEGVSFSLQLGVYSTLENAVRAIDQSQQQVGENIPVLLYIAEHNGQTRYKLLTGLYKDRDAAERQRDKLGSRGLTSFVRPVSALSP